MRYFFLLIGTLFFAATASAQQPIYPLKKEFLDSTFKAQPSEIGARYRRETEQLDSVKGVVRIFFMDGCRQSVREVELRETSVPNGTYESWLDTGQLSHHAEFEHGKRVGEMRLYYPNGQLRRRARYTSNLESTGECFAVDGQPVPYFEYEKMPVYPEGAGDNRTVVNAIQRAVKYPSDALRKQRGGRVLVSFTVTSTGEVADVKVVESVYPSIDAQVVQAVTRLQRFVPGQQDGRPVSVSFTVPVTFAIQ